MVSTLLCDRHVPHSLACVEEYLHSELFFTGVRRSAWIRYIHLLYCVVLCERDICVYIDIYRYTYTCTYIHLHIYRHIDIYTHKYMNIYIYI